jgi:alkyl hydroperoxide reductase subunit AhpC
MTTDAKKGKSGKGFRKFIRLRGRGDPITVTGDALEEVRGRPKIIIHHPPWKVPTINDVFPNLEGQTQDNPEFNLYDYKGSSWAMIFTYPTDFTPVCTTEFVELLKLKPKFQANGIKIVGFCTDAVDTSRNWLRDVEAIVNGYDAVLESSVLRTESSVASTASKVSDGPESEIKVDFPIYSDPTLDVAVELGIVDGQAQDDDGGAFETARSTYVLTPDNKIALINTYPATVGRNWKETLRCILALQVVEQSENCVNIPSHWEYGDKVLIDSKLSDDQCDTYFGNQNWERVYLPSEVSQEVGTFVSGPGGVHIDRKSRDIVQTPPSQKQVGTLPRHYMRYTKQTS